MRLVCLNVWEGRKFEVLSKFIMEIAPATAIFCFQEMVEAEKIFQQKDGGIRFNLLDEFRRMLSDFDCSFATMFKANERAHGAASGVRFGPAIFYRKNLCSAGAGDFYTSGFLRELHDSDPGDVGFFQYQKLETDGKILTVGNLHGLPFWPKEDTPSRIMQSEKVAEFFEAANGPKILCGDFNLQPTTRSIAIFGRDMRNLIKEFDIGTTRSMVNLEKFRDQKNLDHISDYVFVSLEIEVRAFAVSEVEISDHLPLILDFSL